MRYLLILKYTVRDVMPAFFSIYQYKTLPIASTTSYSKRNRYHWTWKRTKKSRGKVWKFNWSILQALQINSKRCDISMTSSPEQLESEYGKPELYFHPTVRGRIVGGFPALVVRISRFNKNENSSFSNSVTRRINGGFPSAKGIDLLVICFSFFRAFSKPKRLLANLHFPMLWQLHPFPCAIAPIGWGTWAGTYWLGPAEPLRRQYSLFILAHTTIDLF